MTFLGDGARKPDATHLLSPGPRVQDDGACGGAGAEGDEERRWKGRRKAGCRGLFREGDREARGKGER